MTRSRAMRCAALVPLLLLAAGRAPVAGQASPGYERASAGTRWLESAQPGGIRIKVLVEPSILGGAEVSIAEIEFPAGGPTAPALHGHGSIELLYVLSGVLEHVVNDETHRLTPGMVGIVRPGDRVAHVVRSEEPVRALVVWAPGDEVERLAPLFRQRPVTPPGGPGTPGG